MRDGPIPGIRFGIAKLGAVGGTSPPGATDCGTTGVKGLGGGAGSETSMRDGPIPGIRFGNAKLGADGAASEAGVTDCGTTGVKGFCGGGGSGT